MITSVIGRTGECDPEEHERPTDTMQTRVQRRRQRGPRLALIPLLGPHQNRKCQRNERRPADAHDVRIDLAVATLEQKVTGENAEH